MMGNEIVPVVLYAGLLVAMIGGAPWPHPNWPVVVAGVVIVGVGAVIKRRLGAVVDAGGERSSGVFRTSAEGSGAVLTKLIDSVRELELEAQSIELRDVAARIDALQTTCVAAVADTQDDFVRRNGFPAWATVMAPLATGERLLYRAWSAASDGHRGETVASIAQALPHLEEAARAMETFTPRG